MAPLIKLCKLMFLSKLIKIPESCSVFPAGQFRSNYRRQSQHSTVFFILAHSAADVLFSVEEIVVEKGSFVFIKGIFNRSTNSSTDLTTVKFVRYGL